MCLYSSILPTNIPVNCASIKRIPVLKKLEEIAYAYLPANRKDCIFFHMAAVIHKRKIISLGHNSFKTHPLAKKYGHRNNSIHAELAAAIKHGTLDCEGLDLAVLRINRKNEISLSKPCVNCHSMLFDLGFNKIYYSNEERGWSTYSFNKHKTK